MENAVIKIDWYVSIDKVKTKYKGVKFTRKESPVVLEQLEWGELRWDYEDGLQLFTTIELFKDCLEWLESFHKKHKVKQVWTNNGEPCSIIHCETDNIADLSFSEVGKFFEQHGLEEDGLVYGYPLPAKKQSYGNRKDVKAVDEKGATTRELTLEWGKGMYVGRFKKFVSGDLKVDALVECTPGATDELVLQSAADMLRSGANYPSDTYRSIQKQCNELFAKR